MKRALLELGAVLLIAIIGVAAVGVVLARMEARAAQPTPIDEMRSRAERAELVAMQRTALVIGCLKGGALVMDGEVAARCRTAR